MKLLVFLSLIGAAFAVPRQPTRIVGGEPTTVQQYPYMSNMNFGFLGIIWYQACGGSLLTSSTILSAAHCYAGDSPSSWRVYLGTSQQSGVGGSLHLVSNIRIHESYSGATLHADIAIITLSTPAVFSDSIQPARIAGPNYNLPDGTPVHAIGWGILSTGGASPQILQHVEVATINHQLCAERYAYLKTQPDYLTWPDILPDMLCAGILDVGGKDACQGDSGGPLAHFGDILVGVTSWGYECADAFYPGVNARVSYHSNWIVQHGGV